MQYPHRENEVLATTITRQEGLVEKLQGSVEKLPIGTSLTKDAAVALGVSIDKLIALYYLREAASPD